MRTAHLLIASLLLTACAQSAQTPVDVSGSSSSATAIASSSTASATEERYFFRYFDAEGVETEWANLHGQLIDRDPITKKETVLWENKNMGTLEILKDKGNAFGIYTKLNDRTLLLHAILTFSDSTILHLFKFDLQTHTITPMKFGESRRIFFNTAYLSPDNQYLVWLNYDHMYGLITLEATNLVTDTTKTLATEADDESFSSGCENLGCLDHDIVFTGPRTLEMVMFRRGECGTNGVVCNADKGRPILRYRKAKIEE